MYILWDIELLSGLHHRPGTMHRLRRWLLPLVGKMCRKLPKWHLHRSQGQRYLHRWVFRSDPLDFFADALLACSSSCGTCAGSADFCLTCVDNKLASAGSCVTSCPSNSFSSSGSCVACHPDCATCSGNSFNQCSSCPSDRPVLTNGRCLPTCSKSQFFDTTSSSCQSCDSSCSSCSGSGPSNCLACSSSSQVLQGGTCTTANCNATISGLGVCLSDLVTVPQASGTSSASALPTITGLTDPTPAQSTMTSRPLQWWEILLMALGCAFIFVVILTLWRRRMRKKRAQQTAAFAAAKNIDKKGTWKFRLMRFGERLFGHAPTRMMNPVEEEEMQLMKMRNVEQERHLREMKKLGGPSSLPSYYDFKDQDDHDLRSSSSHSRPSSYYPPGSRAYQDDNRMSPSRSESIYSQVTGMPRKTPDPRQPVKEMGTGLTAAPPLPNMGSRFSWTTQDTKSSRRRSPESLAPPPQATEAQEYVRRVRTPEGERGAYWLEPTNTGASASKNPFRR